MNKPFVILLILIFFFRQTLFSNANDTYINTTNIIYDEKKKYSRTSR